LAYGQSKEEKMSNKWRELADLCERATYFLHEMQQRDKAATFIEKIRMAMLSIGFVGKAIIGETALALIAEYDGEWEKGHLHRIVELRLIEALHNSITEDQTEETIAFLLQDRDWESISVAFELIKQTYEAHAQNMVWNIMEYKGYIGLITPELDAENIYHGEVVDIKDVITFQGTCDEIEQAFHDSVDDYINFCDDGIDQLLP
jgi:predicted RNase H-like HicB family nuclease